MNHINFYGANWCPDCTRAKQFLNDNNISFNFIDVDIDEKATQIVETINKGKRIIPTIVINDVSYTNPDNNKLATILGINSQGKIILYGANWCPDCRRAKSFLQNNSINFQFIDVDKDEDATTLVEKINNGKRIIPTILIDGIAHTNPDNAKLTALLQLNLQQSKKVYDAVIIGAGAAGMTTAIYAQRDKKNTLILEKAVIGGNASLTKKIENYPGFTEVSGPDLMNKMAEQAKLYGAEIETGVVVQKILKNHSKFTITSNMGNFYSKTVIISVGSTYRKLGIPGEDTLIGSGVHFCATCDGAFYKNREVIVIGGGNSALEESIFLASICKKVTIVHYKNEFSASKTYIDKLKEIDNIKVIKNKTSKEFLMNDDELFKGIKVSDNDTKKEEIINADGAFIFIGLTPNTSFLNNFVETTNRGHIKTTGLGETSVKGVFAAGDCREGAIAQVAAATGEGVMASYGIKNYFKNN